MRLLKGLGIVMIAAGLLSCGSSSLNGDSVPLGNNRILIKNGATTIAQVVGWTGGGDSVGVYIPSVDKYAVIQLSTGLYQGFGVSASATFYYPVDGCANTPPKVSNGFVGEIGKAIVYHNLTGKYYRVTAESSIYNYSSSWDNEGGCSNLNGTVSTGYMNKLCDIVETTRPYNFEPLAPLTVTYE